LYPLYLSVRLWSRSGEFNKDSERGRGLAKSSRTSLRKSAIGAHIDQDIVITGFTGLSIAVWHSGSAM